MSTFQSNGDRRSISTLRDAFKKLLDATERQPLTICGVWDISDAKSEGEIRLGLLTQLGKHASPLLERGLNVVSFPCQLYNTDEASIEILKRAAPLPEINVPSIVMVNVAKITEGQNGRRKDHLFVAVTKHDRIVFGYAAEESAILDQVLPHLKALFVFRVPEAWDRHAHFRSRTVLPLVIALLASGLLSLKTNTEQTEDYLHLLDEVPLGNARELLHVAPVEHSLAWWPDMFGGDQKPHNIKTAIDQYHPILEGLSFGDILLVRFGEGKEHEVVYGESLQSAKDHAKPALTIASSGYYFPNAEQVHYLDIMCFGDSAYEYFDCPKVGTPMVIRHQAKKAPAKAAATAEA